MTHNLEIKRKYLEYLDSKTGYETYNKFKVFLYGKDDSLVEQMYRGILNPSLSKISGRIFRICDIGGGDGKRIVSLLLKAHRDFPELRFKLFFVEPSKYAFQVAKKNLSRLKSFSMVTMKNSTFKKVVLPHNSFNLVLLIHSIFTFSNHKNMIKIEKLKSKGGRTLVVANQPGSFLSLVNEKSHKDFTGKRYEVKNFLKDLKILYIRHTITKHTIKFFIPRRKFSQFSKTLITWTSLGQSGDDMGETKKNLENLLKTLATKKNNQGFSYQETEVFIVF